jgi:hypothetical protein
VLEEVSGRAHLHSGTAEMAVSLYAAAKRRTGQVTDGGLQGMEAIVDGTTVYLLKATMTENASDPIRR